MEVYKVAGIKGTKLEAGWYEVRTDDGLFFVEKMTGYWVVRDADGKMMGEADATGFFDTKKEAMKSLSK